jgi:DNA-binding NarL/FixJ family response regulator
VVVCSDIRLLRDGITLAVAQDGLMDVVGAIEPEDAPAVVAAQRPDVVLLDASVAGGRGLPRLLKELGPDLRIVVFALAAGEVDVVGWAEAGVDGYVVRDGTVRDLTAAVESALRGEVFCSPRLVGLLFARVAQLSEGAAPDAGAGGLTPREQEIMALVEQGLSNKEIARRLGIGHATVKNHVHRILEKTRTRGRGEAVAQRRRAEQASPDPTSGTGRRPAHE